MGAPDPVPVTEPGPAVRLPSVPSPRPATDPPAAADPPDPTAPAADHPPAATPPAVDDPATRVPHSLGNGTAPAPPAFDDPPTADTTGEEPPGTPPSASSPPESHPAGSSAQVARADAPALPRQRDPAEGPADITGALEALGERSPAAAQLLCLCAVLHPAPVPVDVFTRSLPILPRPLGGVAPMQFNGLVAALVGLGLAHRGSQGLRVPEPVREAVRADLGEAATAVCRAYAGSLVAAAVPDQVAEPSSWPRWAVLAPHLIASDAAHSPDPVLRAAACSLVVSLLHRGKARPARTIATELHTGWRETLGPDHPDTLRCAHELARSLVAAGALLPARKLLDETITRLAGTLGATHPQTRVAAETRRGVLLRMGGAPRADGSRGKAAHRRRRQP
ncbi:hypothetical protein Abr02nite_31680 [Paractinoplanes brasiliensis]|nr:hypothetical protein Abr02nite_31680 [Actinoplanes brasiliensis]